MAVTEYDDKNNPQHSAKIAKKHQTIVLSRYFSSSSGQTKRRGKVILYRAHGSLV